MKTGVNKKVLVVSCTKEGLMFGLILGPVDFGLRHRGRSPQIPATVD